MDKSLEKQNGEKLPDEIISQLVKDSVVKAMPIIEKDFEGYRVGVQYNVEAPSINRLKTKVFPGAERTFQNLPTALDAFDVNRNVWDAQNLGRLNVTGIGTDKLVFDYHSRSGGKDFKIIVGQRVEYDNISPSEAVDILPVLLNTLQDRGFIGNHLRKTIFLSTISNMGYFDREGNSLPDSTSVRNLPKS